MPVWYNPLGTRAVEFGTVNLAPNASLVFGFNGILHLFWAGPAPSLAYFQFTSDAGATWDTLYTFALAGGQMISVMVATGITRVRRQNAGGGVHPIQYGGWRFT